MSRRRGPDVFDLVELILKRRERLERLIREPALQAQLIPKFLAISLLGFVFFGVALALVFTAAGQWPRLICDRRPDRRRSDAAGRV